MQAFTLRPTSLKIALLLSSTAFTLFAVEIGLRLAAPQPEVFLNYGNIYAFDPVTGYRLIPGAIGRGGHIRINSLGFRDREYPAEKPPNTFRIIVLGDSFTFGAGPIESIYTKVLERKLQQEKPRPPDYEVWSVGVPGWGTDEELEWLRREGLRYDPDLVVLGFYVGNDMNDNRVLAPQVAVDGWLVRRSEADSLRTPARRLQLRARALLHDFHLYRLVQRRLFGIDPLGADNGSVDEAGGNTSRMVRVYRDRTIFFSSKPQPGIEHGWNRTEELLIELAEVLEKRSILLLVLIIPEQFQINVKLADRIRAELGPEGAAALDLKLPQRRLADTMTKAGIQFLDLLPAFENAGRSESLYHLHNAHWNEAGNLLGGNLLFEALQQRRLLPD